MREIGMGSGRARGGAIPVVRLCGRQSRNCFHDRRCRRAAAGRGALGAIRDARRELAGRALSLFVVPELMWEGGSGGFFASVQ